MTTDTIKFKRGVKSKLNNLSYGEPAYISDENELYIGTENGVEKITRNKEVAELSSQLEHTENSLNLVDTTLENISNDVTMLEEHLEHKAIELSTVENLKQYDAKLGDRITTFGYYSSNDGGGAKYIIVDNGEVDNGGIIQLNNGLKAQIVHNGTIYARQFGVKLDGATDDTNRLNNFMKYFGKAKLVVDNGTCLISDTIQCEGKWRKDNSSIGYDNKTNRLEFINATIKYIGEENKTSILFYNHYKSKISGLSIERNSNINNVQFIGCWYIKFSDFEVGNISFNEDISIPFNTLKTKTSTDNLFENGFIYNGCLCMDSSSGYLNNQNFTSVTMKSDNSEHSVVLKGGHFQKLKFEKCDISYSTVSTFCIVDNSTSNNSSIILDSCYFDSKIPLFNNLDLKGFILTKINCVEASANANQKTIIKTKDYIKTLDTNIVSVSGKHLPTYYKNFAINSDFRHGYYNGNAMYKSGDLTYTFVRDGNKHKLNLIWNGTTQGNIRFIGLNAPISCDYMAYARIKKISGTGSLQLCFNSVYTAYDFSDIADGDDIILSPRCPSFYTEGTKLEFSINKPVASEPNTLNIDVIEVGIIPGHMVQLGLPSAFGCDLTLAGNTNERPNNMPIGFCFFDRGLGKPIWRTNSGWVDSAGASV